ncbi:hypothetical protein E2C01_008060 [Portunus trituberculatus]|uniref:Uncharacterized protein n=1 Tax=Portunus trituberculatus TaxID=210409 RepID=A0A5B7D2X1_PORTR|nr:hypothetical protein [Portunus trituberculatus]
MRFFSFHFFFSFYGGLKFFAQIPGEDVDTPTPEPPFSNKNDKDLPVTFYTFVGASTREGTWEAAVSNPTGKEEEVVEVASRIIVAVMAAAASSSSAAAAAAAAVVVVVVVVGGGGGGGRGAVVEGHRKKKKDKNKCKKRRTKDDKNKNESKKNKKKSKARRSTEGREVGSGHLVEVFTQAAEWISK